jgi:hypothetical protein
LKSTKAINPLSTCTLRLWYLFLCFIIHHFFLSHIRNPQYIYIYHLWIEGNVYDSHWLVLDQRLVRLYICLSSNIYIYTYPSPKEHFFFSEKYTLFPNPLSHFLSQIRDSLYTYLMLFRLLKSHSFPFFDPLLSWPIDMAGDWFLFLWKASHIYGSMTRPWWYMIYHRSSKTFRSTFWGSDLPTCWEGPLALEKGVCIYGQWIIELFRDWSKKLTYVFGSIDHIKLGPIC